MKIFIDAGHNYSGEDTGAQGNGLKEQDITYQISQKLGSKLISKGIDVKYSRPTITSNVGATLNESLNGRCNMANSWTADYFISIHCNASSSAKSSGTETLIYSDSAKALAEYVNTKMVGLGLNNRGVKQRQNLAVLKLTKMPAILIETAFITSPSDAEFLTKKQDNIAQAIGNAIIEFLGINSEESEDIEVKMIYNYIDDNMPDWARPTIKKLVDKGYLKGNDKGELGLDDTMLKIFVVNDRAGLYD